MAGNEPGITGFTGVKVGDGRGYPSATSYWAINSSVVTVVATTVANGGSATTTATISGFTVGDPCFATPGSATSAGLSMHAFFTAGDTVTIQYQNVSTATVAQVALPVIVTAFKR